MTKVVVVGIDNIQYIKNYADLPPAWYSKALETMIMVHSAPAAVDAGGGVLRNYMFRIEGIIDKDGDSPVVDIVEDRESVYTLTRHRKSDMQAVIARAVVDFEKWADVPTYTVTDNRIHAAPTKRLVIKPQHGARGIGQLLVDPRQVSLNALFLDIASLDPKKGKEAIDAYFETLKPHVTYYPGVEAKELEGVKALTDKEGLVVQEYIDNVTEEYRLIVSHGEIVYIQKRERKGDTEYKQATGAAGSPIQPIDKDVFDWLDGDSFGIVKAMDNLSKEIGILFSADLFFTEDGKWGLFEYSNQFGHTAIPDRMYLDIMKNNVERAIERVFKLQPKKG